MMKMYLKSAVLALPMLLLSAGVFAQAHDVKGKVLDEEQQPIPGANVIIKGTTSGTITAGNGEFSMKASDGDVLVISYMGYVNEEVTVNGAGPYNVSLVPDLVGLDEVVVVGYGVQKKSDVTGAISSVKAEDLERRSSTSAVQAMQGKAAGVSVITSSAKPGGDSEIRVRGVSSNSSSIGPLLIVDGLKVDNINYLDPSMIQSMEILKDAASAAIYGAEAGNGVVLITTKSGSKQDGKIFYNFQYSMNKLGHNPKMMNAEQYINWNIEAFNFTKEDLYDKYGYVDGTDTDWAKEIFGTGITQRHTIGAQGGNDRGSYYLAITSLDDNGIVKGNKDVYKRLSAQINADYKIKDWFTVSTNTSIERWSTKDLGEHNEYGGAENSLFLSATIMDPLTPVYYSDEFPMPNEVKNAMEKPISVTLSPVYTEATDTNVTKYGTFYTREDPVEVLDSYQTVFGDENGYYAASKIVEGDAANPFVSRDFKNAKKEGFNVRGTISADIKPFKGFVYTSRFGYRIQQRKEDEFKIPFYYNTKNGRTTYDLTASATNDYYYQWENFANYNVSLGANNFGAMAGMSYIESHNFTIGGQLSGNYILSTMDENFRYMQYYNTNADLCTRSITGGTPGESANISYFGRLSWSYDDRYNLQANFRADAFDTSKLGKDNRWGKFPSVSAGWTLSKEAFLQDALSAATISFLKLRGSWGQNGNISVLSGPNAYGYATTVTKNSQKYQFDPAGKISLGSYSAGLPNPDLKWETSEQIDLGLDGRLLNDRLSFTVEYYNKKTKDLLVPVTPVRETGVTSVTLNAGKVINKGMEFELGWKDKVGDFSYSVNVNGATLKNEVTYLDPTIERIQGSSFANYHIWTYVEEGHNIWYFRGYDYAGVLDDKMLADQSKRAEGEDEWLPEDLGSALFYKEDGSITRNPSQSDMKDLGSGIAKFSYGITLNFEYKNFDFTLFGTGMKGNKIWACNYRTEHPKVNGMAMFYEGRSIAQYDENDFVTGLTKVGKYPICEVLKGSVPFYSSSANIHDGSFFKIKQIQLGYTIPNELTSKLAIASFRMFVALDDYFLFTKYEGYDPEVASNGTANSRGIDKGSYPSSKKVTFGLNMTF